MTKTEILAELAELVGVALIAVSLGVSVTLWAGVGTIGAWLMLWSWSRSPSVVDTVRRSSPKPPDREP